MQIERERENCGYGFMYPCVCVDLLFQWWVLLLPLGEVEGLWVYIYVVHLWGKSNGCFSFSVVWERDTWKKASLLSLCFILRIWERECGGVCLSNNLFRVIVMEFEGFSLVGLDFTQSRAMGMWERNWGVVDEKRWWDFNATQAQHTLLGEWVTENSFFVYL